MVSNKKQYLYLLRGLPGSGKTTYANKILSCETMGGHIVEADDFFVNWDEEAKYNFSKEFLREAHQLCFARCCNYLYHGGSNAVISNTNTKFWEMEKYFDLLDRFPNLEIFVIHLKTQFENIHGVPEEHIKTMSKRFQSNQEIADELSKLNMYDLTKVKFYCITPDSGLIEEEIVDEEG